MALDFNPDSPGTLGEQWFPTVQGSQSIASDNAAVVVAVASTAAETVASISTYVDDLGGNTSAPLMVEIFEAGDEVPGAVSTTTFRPNSTITNGDSDWWKNGWTGRGTYSVNFTYAPGDVVRYSGAKYLCILANSPGTFPSAPNNATYWTNIASIDMQGPVQESTLDLTDYVKYEGGHSDYSRLEWGFDTSAWAGSGTRRIIDVRLMFVASTQSDVMTVQPRYTDGDSPYPTKFTGVVVEDNVQTFLVDFGPMHPDGVDTRPWTDDDIDNLDAGSPTGFGFKPWNGRSRGLRIYQVWLEVDWVAENRVAYGVQKNIPAPYLLAATKTATVVGEPDGSANWPKADATDYIVLWRRVPMLTGSALTCAIRYLGGGFGTPPQDSYIPTLSGGLVTTLGDARGRGVPHIEVTTTPTNGVDSMPYVFLGSSWVDTANGDIRSDFTATATASGYRLVRAIIRRSEEASHPLAISVRKTSDNSIQSGTLYLSPEDVDALPIVASSQDGVWHLLDDFIPGIASLTAATEYYVNFSNGDPPFTGYYVAYLTTEGSAADRSYGGTAVCFHAEGFTLTDEDGLVTFSTAPDPPQDFTVTAATYPVSDDGSGCPIQNVTYADITWTPTALGTDFAGYEIQRADADDLNWQDIALITSESVWEAQDSDARFGQLTLYRMRVLRADGSRSEWTLTDFVTLDAPTCGLSLSSNVRPDLTIAYQDIGPRSFTFADADATTFSTRYGQGYQTVAYPLEAGSDVIPLRLMIFAESDGGDLADPVDGPGRRVFDPLLRIAGQTVPRETKVVLPYLCLRNETGDRWFGTLVVNSSVWDAALNQYIADCTFTETTVTPYVFDVDLTGAMVLARADAWWDARTYTGAPYPSLPVPLQDLVGDNDLTLTPGAGDFYPYTQTVDPLQIAAGVKFLKSPGWDDMWFDTPAPTGLAAAGLDVRIRGSLTKLVAGLADGLFNIFLHQGNTDDGNFSWALRYAENSNHESTLYWSEDGTTLETEIVLQSSSPDGTVNRAWTFDPSTGTFSLYEQPYVQPNAAAPADLDQPLTSDHWTLVDTATVGATSLFDSDQPVRNSSSTTPDMLDAFPAIGFGSFERIALRLGTDGNVCADLNVGLLDMPLAPWVVVGGYPPPPPTGITEACEAPMYGQAGEVWTVHNFQTGSTPIVVADRTTIVTGNGARLLTPIDPLFDINATDDLTVMVCYRWSRAEILGQSLLDHKTYDAPGLNPGYTIVQASSVGGGPTPVIGDGVDAQHDVTPIAVDGTVATAGFVVDRTANTVEGFTNGVGSGSPASLAAVGSPSVPGQPLSIGATLKADLTVGNYGGFEFLGAAVFRRADLTDEEWAAIHAFNLDPTLSVDGYSPR